MKTSWKQFLIAFAGGVLVTALFLLVMLPPRGEPLALSPAPTDAPIAVYISGKVLTPGMYMLEPGSRVDDLVNAAGGFTEDASADAINLAARLQDGMQVDIPSAGEEPAATIPAISLIPSQDKININLAGVDELMELPGIGNTKAAAVVNYRTENGDFDSITDIMEVPGIGTGIYDQIKDLITVD